MQGWNLRIKDSHNQQLSEEEILSIWCDKMAQEEWQTASCFDLGTLSQSAETDEQNCWEKRKKRLWYKRCKLI